MLCRRVVLTLSQISQSAADTQFAFLVAMLTIGMIVLAVSTNVAIFLVDTGLLFEEFFQRISHLIIPAFAFLTFYS
jgi:mRNA degradation ribonuclease J1/J2